MNLWPAELKQELAPDLKVQLFAMTEVDLDAVIAVEQAAYSHAWTLGNFRDALKAGYVAYRLVAGEHLVGYFVAMQVIDEVHLLNITVAPAFQRQGWALCLMQSLSLWSKAKGAEWLWLEVRESNERALALYKAFGFKQVGLRKDYYPAGRTHREAAVVMSMPLNS
jgi:ribosomal-protein-alanine N-acetyltransferase